MEEIEKGDQMRRYDRDMYEKYNPKSKSKGSVELGDLILDYNNKKELVGIQIMNASKLIKEMVDKKDSRIIKEVLNNLMECKLDIKVKNNLLIIKVYLLSESKELSPIISVPSIKESSPALAYT